MSWFNTYATDGDGLTRTVTSKVSLRRIPLPGWTLDELGYRLAVLFPQVDGYGHDTAPDEVKSEIESLMAEIKARGYDPISNLRWNENVTGWGWLNWFEPLKEPTR